MSPLFDLVQICVNEQISKISPSEGDAGGIPKAEVLNLSWNDVNDEYDPRFPNNYEVFLDERLRENQQKARKEKLRSQMQAAEEDRKLAAIERKKIILQGGTDEDYENFPRGKSMILPSWIKKK